MKTLKYFLIDIANCLIISVPCYFLCDLISEKNIVNWLDIQIGLGGAALLLLVVNILLSRRKMESKITKITKTATIVAIVATAIYGTFILLEWLFPNDAEGFTSNWNQWFPVSISMSFFLYFQNRHREQNYKNDNDLVIAAECQKKTEAETICAMLEKKA